MQEKRVLAFTVWLGYAFRLTEGRIASVGQELITQGGDFPDNGWEDYIVRVQ